ncbi:MAG: hypothetical protein AAFY74_06050 [Pseudomonadota bacterium]
MRRLLMIASLLVASIAATLSSAATVPILPTGTTSVEVTAPIGALGLGATPLGTATVNTAGANPVFDFPITGGLVDTTAGALIEHNGSGVELFATASPSTTLSLENFLIDTDAGTVSGLVNGVANAVLFDFGTVDPSGIQLTISGFLAGALTTTFGAPNLSGVEFGIANTAPETAVIPLPAGGVLLLSGLGFLALRRRA